MATAAQDKGRNGREDGVVLLVNQAYRFALDPTPAQRRALASHCGAAGVADNWGLDLVQDRLEQRRAGEVSRCRGTWFISFTCEVRRTIPADNNKPGVLAWT